MWQAPNQRLRALAAQRRREREKQRVRLHLKRVVGELRIPAAALGEKPQVIAARVVLNDLSVNGVALFSPVMLAPGQPVQLTVDQPRKFFVAGQVAWSQEITHDTHIISPNPFRYRVGVEFRFSSATEEEEVKKFVEEILNQHLVTRKEKEAA